MSDPAPGTGTSRSRTFFFLLLIAIGCVALWYLISTEPMGIEERFSSALGIAPAEDEPGHEEGGGFALEGSPVLFVLVLVLLAIVCWLVYRKYGA